MHANKRLLEADTDAEINEAILLQSLRWFLKQGGEVSARAYLNDEGCDITAAGYDRLIAIAKNGGGPLLLALRAYNRQT